MRMWWCAGLLALTGGFAHAAELPLDTFIKHAQFLDVKISPDGKYLAASVLATEDTGALVILDRASLKPTGNFKLRGRTFVQQFHWANNERIVFSVAEKRGSLSNPGLTGEIYATNWDGTGQELLIGGRQEARLEAARRKQKYEGAFLVDALAGDDKNVIVSVFDRGTDEGAYPTLERLNVSTGARSRLARAPVLNADYVVDGAGNVRFAHGSGTDNAGKLYYRDANSGTWRLLNDAAKSGVDMHALTFDASDAKAYLLAEEQEGPDSLYLWDPATDTKTRVLRDDNTDPFEYFPWVSPSDPYLPTLDRRGRLLALTFMDGLPRREFVQPDAPEAKLLKSLSASFPGQWVSPRSYTDDGSEMVFSVSSDRNPGEFYLLDKDRKATYLLSNREWIDPEQMAASKPISFAARDGMTIHGYLTVPKGGSGKNLPLVIHPHGGPFGPFDTWRYDEQVQLLANRGYAVLQVNFRGSGNHGAAFEAVGYRQWGGTMQDDLTDATRWAIAQGVADAERICLYGASYGGYASAMGIAKEPDLYRCAAGYVGLYDLAMWYRVGDVQERDRGVNYLKKAVGTGQELARGSVTNFVDRIQAPLFLIAGGEDERCPPEQSERLRDLMEKAGKPVEWLYNAHEGHGFYKEASNRELYTKLLAFLAKHIGSDAAPATATASNGSP